MEEVQGIDSYLHEFSETFTEKIQDSFVPLFIPNQDKYSKDLQIVSDYMQWSDDISLYHAQKDIAQAVSNAFNSGKKNCFIVGEMGSGKTTISIAAINTHHAMYEREAHRDYLTNIVMCPSHLVHMWKREIEDRSPRSEAVIITDFSHLMSLVNKIKGKKEKHLWLIISKDIAKLGIAHTFTSGRCICTSCHLGHSPKLFCPNVLFKLRKCGAGCCPAPQITLVSLNQLL